MTFRFAKPKGLSPRTEGLIFETELVQQAWREKFSVVKIPTGAKIIGRVGKRPTLSPIKTPFDFVLVKHGRPIFTDAKTTSEKAFGHSKITPHQLHALSNLEEAGCVAGYLVNFRTLDTVSFFKASTLRNLNPRQSLKPSDGTHLGTSSNFKLEGLL